METKRELKGTKRERKGTKEDQKGTKMEPKGAKREPKGDQNASRSRPSEKVAKMMPKGRAATGHDHRFWEPFLFKK